MRAVYRKELRQYFHSVIGYFFLAGFLFVSAYCFVQQNLMNRSGDISRYFSSVISFMMFLMPMLTMRSFAEEKRQRTDWLLLSMPVRVRDIVLGKFLAALSMTGIGVLATLAFPVMLRIFGAGQPWVTLGNYLGMTLLLACFLAVGMLVSALTENQIAAAVVTYAVLFALWFSSGFSNSIQHQRVLDALGSVSLMERFYELSIGVFNPATILLYLTITALCLFFMGLALSGQLRALAPYAAMAVVAAVAFNCMTGAAVKRFGLRLDLTDAGLFRLTDTTREIATELREPVEIICLSPETDADDYLREVLRRYGTLSGQISVRYVNLAEQPGIAAEYAAKGQTLTGGGVIVAGPYGERVYTLRDMYELSGGGRAGDSVTGFQAERRLTSAILEVTTEKESRVLLMEGHSENLNGALEELLAAGGYESVRAVLEMEDIREDTAAVIVAGPTKDYSAREIERLDKFLARGGSLLVFRGAGDGALPLLDAFLAEWGIAPSQMAVLDALRQIDGPSNVVPNFSSHLINVFFSENRSYLVLPECRALTVVADAGKHTIPLLQSSAASYGRALDAGVGDAAGSGGAETGDAAESGGTEAGDAVGSGDADGPFVLAATSEQGDAHLVVCGSSAFYTEALLSAANIGNSDFILQALAWCNGTEAAANVPVKTFSAQQISITWEATAALAVILLGLIPGALALCGVCVFLRRRHL